MTETFISETELNELSSLLNRKHASFLGERRFSIKADLDGDGIFVDVVLRNEDETYFYPVSTRIDLSQEELNAKDAALFLIDFVDLYFDDYFDGGESVFLPIDWTDFQYDAVNFQMKGQIINQRLESMADQLLQNS